MNSENCYTCKHKGDVPGSAHSRCNHPLITETKGLEELLLLKAATGFGSTNPLGVNVILTQENGEIKTVPLQDWHETGIRKGYVLFPFDFDPTWLKHCLLHSKKD